ncbi:formylmethanofuran dehydrogenase [Desulfovibrio aerotolerans]|uniref:Formylmethanofuran dehydrogenase n=1 Tax=Solidesulfovibrio aerotolerans TaxID=295255 RepID=A0A7C9MJ28_9BACT|nr:FmdE family protein [Solidesulfovibrio aerotolerans]MYL81853.1 formylmethanofuran dehydrogenase [Solidesulfovibrio aerotolerans]
MSCSFPAETIERVVLFHGHSCPGLSIGIRAAEYALQYFGDAGNGELVCITETDMCGVDALQYLTGCTLGKGNLIHKDYGKMAFSFHHRPTAVGIRLRLRPETRGEIDAELAPLQRAIGQGTATPKEHDRAKELRRMLVKRFMTLPLEALFDRQELETLPPRPAQILESLPCACCGEKTMESRTRRLGGQTLCIPCFLEREQKI